MAKALALQVRTSHVVYYMLCWYSIDSSWRVGLFEAIWKVTIAPEPDMPIYLPLSSVKHTYIGFRHIQPVVVQGLQQY